MPQPSLLEKVDSCPRLQTPTDSRKEDTFTPCYSIAACTLRSSRPSKLPLSSLDTRSKPVASLTRHCSLPAAFFPALHSPVSRRPATSVVSLDYHFSQDPLTSPHFGASMTPTATSSHTSSTSASSSSSGALTPAQLAQFHREGYLVLPRFFDPTALLARAKDLVQSFSLEGHPLTTFSTGRGDEDGAETTAAEKEEQQRQKEKKKHVGDRYFLESGDKVRFFLEEEAVGADGKLNRDKSRAVNKVGHGEWQLSSEESVYATGFMADATSLPAKSQRSTYTTPTSTTSPSPHPSKISHALSMSMQIPAYSSP